MEREFARWDDIDVHYRDQVITSGGHGFAAISRKRLLQILQQRCAGPRRPDVLPHRGARPGHPGHRLRPRHRRGRRELGDAGGVRRRVRARCRVTPVQVHLAQHRPRLRRLQVLHRADPVRRHAGARLPLRRDRQHVHRRDAQRRLGGRRASPAWRRPACRPASPTRRRSPGSPTCSADIIGEHAIEANNSKWISFGTLRCRSWRHRNVVLLGDAAHTAHFSIGSGTKLAMEDALALAACLNEQPDVDAALTAYEAERRPVVESTQRAAQASLEWFENLGQYTHQDPEQFAFNIITRSRRVTHDNLRLRDPEFTASVDAWFAADCKRRGLGTGEVVPPMFQPMRLRELELKNRVVVSAMDMYSASDGTPSDFHLVHLGGKAAGGAGLVMTEMVCVSPQGRITPGCAGHVRARARGGLAADHRLRARVHDRQDRAAARPLRPQGLDQADVGGHRRAARRRQLGGLRAVADPVPGRAEPGAARADRRRDGADQGRVRRRDAGGRAGRVRPARAALRARLPAVVVHLADHQPAHRRLRRVAGGAAALSARGVRGHAGGLAGRQADDGADLGDRLGARRHHRRRRPADRPALSPLRAPTRSTSPPAR